MGLFKGFGAAAAKLDAHPARDDAALRATCDDTRGGDWRPARDLLAEVGSDHDRRAHYVSVLGQVVAGVRDPVIRFRWVRPVDTEAAWSDQWAREEPSNPDALLVRANSLITRAWRVRGGTWAKHVPRQRFKEFHRLLRLAVPLCHRAAELAPADPTPWVQLMRLATTLGADRTEADRLWAEVRQRDPLHREAHDLRLIQLCRKWGGSHEEMFSFARNTAWDAPEGSPLHVLPLKATVEWALWEINRGASRTGGMKVQDVWRKSPAYAAELDNALHRWFKAAPSRHARWFDDLNHLAYGLRQAHRHVDAKAVFEAIGPYATELPWIWDPMGGEELWTLLFRSARRRAERA